MKRYTKIAASIVAGLVGATLLAAPAAAEGDFTSSISGATPAFKSRVWTDRNSTAVSTVVSFSSCSVKRSANNAAVALGEVRINLEKSGSQVSNQAINCGAVNFGRVNAGDYNFKLTSINGKASNDLKLSVGVVKVKY